MLNRILVTILLTLFTLDGVYCFPKCVPKEIKHRHKKPWKVDPFKYVNFMYGFPLDFFGGLIGTVLMDDIRCNLKVDRSKLECTYHVISKYCHPDVSLLSNFTQDAPAQCPLPTLEEKKGVHKEQTWRIRKSFTGQVGQYHTRRIKMLKQYFDACIDKCIGLKIIAGAIHCDILGFVYALGLGRQLERNQLSWDMSAENVYGVYLYWLCDYAWSKARQNSTIEFGLFPLCPNPCSIRRGRCSRIPNTLPAAQTNPIMYAISESNCIRRGTGLVRDNFECLCKPGFEWNQDSKQCSRIDLCAEDTRMFNLGLISEEQRLCSSHGTLRCVTLHSQPLKQPILQNLEEAYSKPLRLISNHQCVCRSGYMGYRCHRLRNACIESEFVGHPPGNSACRTFLGNKCHAIVGTSRYSCECLGLYMQNGSLPFPNCYLHKTACDGIICRNRGSCVHSPDNSAFRCRCAFGWRGEYCELRDVRIWLPWGPWSLCSSTMCAGPGWQRRERICRVPVNKTTGFGECRGHNYELRPCDVGCIQPFQSFLPIVKIVLFFSVCLLILQLAGGMIYLLLRYDISQIRATRTPVTLDQLDN